MDVILMERVESLGQMGDVVTVKDGYARNYLLPQRKALRATESNRDNFELQRADLEASNIERRGEAESIGDKMDDLYIVLTRQSSETGQLYGSANARDISDGVTEAGYKIDRKQVLLDRSIKTMGIHPVRVSLHPEVTITVNVNIARSEAEADHQEAAFRSGALGAGAPAVARSDEDADAAEAEKMFEDSSLAPNEESEGESEDQPASEAQDDQEAAGQPSDETVVGDSSEEDETASGSQQS
jgi:large subunit ribosomal protein L9